MENETQFESFENLPMPNNNMPLAIITTVLGCCSPLLIGFVLGLVGIYFSTQVKTKYESGDYETAKKYSKYVKIISFIVIGLIVIGIIYNALNWDENMARYQELMEQMQQNQ